MTNAKAAIIAAIAGATVSGIFGIISAGISKDNGYQSGFQDGMAAGQQAISQTLSQKSDAAYTQGYSEGKDAGYAEGYKKAVEAIPNEAYSSYNQEPNPEIAERSGTPLWNIQYYIEPYNGEKTTTISSVQDNTGITRNNVILYKGDGIPYIDFELNKEYKRLTGTFFITREGDNYEEQGSYVGIWVDGQVMFKRELYQGDEPIPIDVDLTNANKIHIELGLDSNENGAIAGVSDLQMYR